MLIVLKYMFKNKHPIIIIMSRQDFQNYDHYLRLTSINLIVTKRGMMADKIQQRKERIFVLFLIMMDMDT